VTDALAHDQPRGIDADAVTRWLLEHVTDLEAPLHYELIAAGGSNLTFRVEDANGRAIALRRPPVAAVLATAHDMDREWRIISALSPTEVPVPAPLAQCDDVDVTGAPFYVMEFVEGRILRTEADGAELDERAAHAATDSLVNVQVAFHALDVDEIGLGDLAKHRTGYAERQLRRWQTQVERARVRELPKLDALHTALAASVPEETGSPALVHGDYRFDNVVLDDGSRVAAVLDWELATIGDAVADACWSLLYWADPGDALPFLTSSPTLAEVFARRDDVARVYEERSGRSLDALGWFTVFGYWKMACIVEGVYARRLKGASGGATTGDAASIAARVDALLEQAGDVASELGWGTLA
jgi:aminoglycoside phosphotransferase (APT) family kinase protein